MMEAWAAALPSYGGGTFAAFFLAWAVPRFGFIGLDTALGKPPMLQRQFTPGMRRRAWLWCCANWVAVVLPIIAATAPLLRRVFPEDAEWPVWWQVVVCFLLSLCSHDVLCALDAYSLRLLQRHLSDVPPLLSGPLAWGGFYVQPSELVLQALDSFVGPAAWSLLVAPLPVTAWWSWAAVMQVLWVVDRSHYAFPSPSTLLASLMPQQEKKKSGRKGGKPSLKEIAQKRNR